MPNESRLLLSYDVFQYDSNTIKESKEANGGKIRLKGILQRADALNQNGRVYPMAILEREVRNYQKKITERTALGELDHPNDSTINLKNVSHLFVEMHWEGSEVHGTVELLDTPSGKILQSLVESNVKLGVSSRGVGSTEKKGDYHIVQEDFQLVCIDFVSEPSTCAAFMIPEGIDLSNNDHYKRIARVDKALNAVLSLSSKRR